MSKPATVLTALLASSIALSACSKVRAVGEDEYSGDYRTKGGERGRMFGDQGLVLGIGGKASTSNDEGGGALGVNAYLWRAALDTLGFMPLASADPFGGLIITDWYQPPESPDERLKVHVLIMDRALRADAVKVSVFRQTRRGGGWADAPVDPKTSTALEDKILTKARELRIATAQAAG
jgi:predicted small secreted protein